jgi:DNA-binding winged helix-turn-helix (wHTH) protein
VIGSLTIDTGNGAVTVGEQLIHFTPTEYRVVEALALRSGQTLTKEQLLNRLYRKDDEPEIKIVDVFICKIRHKLRLLGADKQVETVWGRGYRLVAEPTVGAWKTPDMPVGTQAAILTRLAEGPANFLQLWTVCPEAHQATVRNALQTLRQRGAVHNTGGPKGALYELSQRVAA